MHKKFQSMRNIKVANSLPSLCHVCFMKMTVLNFHFFNSYLIWTIQYTDLYTSRYLLSQEWQTALFIFLANGHPMYSKAILIILWKLLIIMCFLVCSYHQLLHVFMSCCRLYSQISIAPLTCTFRDLITPCWGISTHTSSKLISSTGIPSFSFLKIKDFKIL